jgi:hypothetical protein
MAILAAATTKGIEYIITLIGLGLYLIFLWFLTRRSGTT